MKQYWKITIMIIICTIFTNLIDINRPKKQPKGDYEVFSSFILSADHYRYRDVRLKVVVYKNYYSRELYRQIEEEENRINGTPTKLTIQLYNSRNDSREGKEPYATIAINYKENTYEIMD